MAPYMIKAVKNMKESNCFPNLHHVTCINHLLHRVCEKIREENDNINEFISLSQSIIWKSFQRIQLFKEKTQLNLPPKAVLTRWGTWLVAAFYYAENFSKVCAYFMDRELDGNSKAIKKIRAIIRRANYADKDGKILTRSLIKILDYKDLPKIITKLESESLSLEGQMSLLYEAKSMLSGKFEEKFDKLLKKNPDLLAFTSSSNFNSSTKPIKSDHQLKIKFAPLTTVAVERSFSAYKSILGDKQKGMTEETIEIRNIVQFNRFLE
jgi:hypothetical protein